VDWLTTSFGMQTNHGKPIRLVCQKCLAAVRETTYQVRAKKVSPGSPVRLLFSFMLLEVVMWSSATVQTVPISNPS
jgi:hypothetical protein